MIELNPKELNDILGTDTILIDVRETSEYEYQHIPGSLLCPLQFFDPDTFPRFDKRNVVFICAKGIRSVAAIKQVRNLEENYDATLFNLTGGINAWADAGYEVEGEVEIEYTI